MGPTHHLYSRERYEDNSEWEPELAVDDEPIGARVTIDNRTVTLSFAWKVRLHDEIEYQLRPIPASPP